MIKTTQTGFYDLNVNESCFQGENLRETLRSLYSFGYRTVAVNQTFRVNEKANKLKKKAGLKDTDCLPEPFSLQAVETVAAELCLTNITFLNRLTLVFSDQENVQKYLKSSNFKKYDIFAVIPATAQALAFICGTLDADILTYNPQNRMDLRLTRKMYNKLVDRGYHFELTYSSAINDSTKRTNLIHLSHLYHTNGKSRNIIFSSGAENHMLLRDAYDVISLGFLFGLNELQSKNAVLYCARNVTVNAIGRRQGKAVMFVEINEENVKPKKGTKPKKVTQPIVIESDEDMDVDEPAQKKSKQ